MSSQTGKQGLEFRNMSVLVCQVKSKLCQGHEEKRTASLDVMGDVLVEETVICVS